MLLLFSGGEGARKPQYHHERYCRIQHSLILRYTDTHPKLVLHLKETLKSVNLGFKTVSASKDQCLEDGSDEGK